MPYANLSQTTLFYTDDRSGPTTALFVHGWGCDSNDWSWQIGPFVKAGMRVIAVDNRGHGRSSVPDDGYDTPRLAADLVELIRRLEISSVVAIGHSLGAYIVATLAVEHPWSAPWRVCTGTRPR